MQGDYKMYDYVMMMPKRIQTKSNSWETPRALQSTPLTRDCAPAIQAKTKEEGGKLSSLRAPC